MKRKYARADPLDTPTNVTDTSAPTMEEVDEAVYGRLNVPASGNQVAKPIALVDIHPDLTQPRRAVPLAVRGQWDGDPEDIPGLLGNWHLMVKKVSPIDIDVLTLITGATEGLLNPPKENNPVVDEYNDLISLAASIHRDGLANPVTVSAQAGAYVIETGERRYLAHWLLAIHVNSQRYEKVAARVVDRADVWRQAAENGARRPLNAVGMARQLALLIMDMYAADPGEKFMRYRDMVLPGEVDRKFYAQVANGNLYRIKPGMGQRVLDVTGLKSLTRIAEHRSLLSIPDEAWVKADTESMTLGGALAYVESLKLTQVSLPDNTFQIRNVLPEEMTQPEADEKPHSVTSASKRPIAVGDKVRMNAALQDWQIKLEWEVQSIAENNLARLIGTDENGDVKRAYQYTHLLRRDGQEALPEAAPQEAAPVAAAPREPVLAPMTPDQFPGDIIDDGEVWVGGVRFRMGEDVNHITGSRCVTITFRHVDGVVWVVVEVLTDRGSYISCCPATELTKPAPVIIGSAPTATAARPAPTPFTPAKPEPHPSYSTHNDNRALADDLRLSAMLAKLQGLAELSGNLGMRDTCNYLRTVTPAQIKREVRQTSPADYQKQIATAQIHVNEFVLGLAQQVSGLLEKMQTAAEK